MHPAMNRAGWIIPLAFLGVFALMSLGAPVKIDEILEALCALDQGPRNPPGGKPMRLRSVERAAA